MAGPTTENSSPIRYDAPYGGLPAPRIDWGAAGLAEPVPAADLNSPDRQRRIVARIAQQVGGGMTPSQQQAMISAVATVLRQSPEATDSEIVGTLVNRITAGGEQTKAERATASNERVGGIVDALEGSSFSSEFNVPTSAEPDEATLAGNQAEQMLTLVTALAQNPPTPEDATFDGEFDPLLYQELTSGWVQNVSGVADLATKLQSTAAGGVTLPDGTSYTPSQLARIREEDPQGFQMIDLARKTALADLTLQYQNTLDQMGLREYNLAQQATAAENSRRMARYNAEVATIERQMQFEHVDMDRTLAGIDRQIKAAPLATKPGKSEYSAADIGGVGEALARLANISPTAPAVKYTGTMNLADVHPFETTPADFPAIPTLASGPPLPALQAVPFNPGNLADVVNTYGAAQAAAAQAGAPRYTRGAGLTDEAL